MSTRRRVSVGVAGDPFTARAGADAGVQRGTGGSLEGVRWEGGSAGRATVAVGEGGEGPLRP